MDNYRNPMYNRYNRNMGAYQSGHRGSCAAPIHDSKRCGCDNNDVLDDCINNFPLAMAYVPMQKWRKVFDACTGLQHGTIFEELVKPWYGEKNLRGMRGGR